MGEMIRRIDDTIQTDEGSALKKAKIDISTAATDILADSSSSSDVKPKESWQKSVGSFSNKVTLTSLVKRKAPGKSTSSASSTASSNVAPAPATSHATNSGASTLANQMKASTSSTPSSSSASSSSKPALGALSMLGGYSGSESGSDSD